MSADFAIGHQRTLFAKPVSPPLYYLQRWLIGRRRGADRVRPSWRRPSRSDSSWRCSVPGFFARVALLYLVIGGLVFLMSTLIRGDWLAVAALLAWQTLRGHGALDGHGARADRRGARPGPSSPDTAPPRRSAAGRSRPGSRAGVRGRRVCSARSRCSAGVRWLGGARVTERWSAGVAREVLPNGLTLLVQRDDSAPVVAVVTHVKAGFFDEPDRWVGISHVLEHMFFKGTARRGVGAVARETKAAGGYLNASTSYDHTAYFTVLPAAATCRRARHPERRPPELADRRRRAGPRAARDHPGGEAQARQCRRGRLRDAARDHVRPPPDPPVADRLRGRPRALHAGRSLGLLPVAVRAGAHDRVDRGSGRAGTGTWPWRGRPTGTGLRRRAPATRRPTSRPDGRSGRARCAAT